jgi:NAD(P)H-dependent FMN reductase
MKIKLIVGSTRTTRVGRAISDGLVHIAKNSGTDIEVVDLKELALPALDAVAPPMYMPVGTDEAKNWSEIVSGADAIIVVTPEYNASIPSGLKDAIDYLCAEWENKPVAVVSYGWMGAGASAAQHLDDIFTRLKSKVVAPKVAIQFSQEVMNQDGSIKDLDVLLSGVQDDFRAAIAALQS